MQGWTPFGLVFLGFVIGTISGFVACYIRGKKDKNRDIDKLLK